MLAIVIVVSAALLLGTWLAGRLGLRPPLSALVTVGMAICGNSAILALSPIIGAKHRETAYAVSTITLFGLIGVLLLPLLGRALAMTDPAFGTWAGLAVNDTAQVVATGYAYSPGAGDVATVVKLTRNLAILPVLLGATWWAARELRDAVREPETATTGAAEAGTRRSAPGAAPVAGPAPAPPSRLAMVSRAVPWFVIGFVIFAGLRSLGLLDAHLPMGGTLADLCSTIAAICILVALAGVGLATDFRAMLAVGARPFMLGAAMWLTIGLLGFAIARVYHGA